MEKNKSDSVEVKGAGIIVTGVAAFLIIVLLLMSVYTIHAGERGVLLTFGNPSSEAVTEGLHFKFPIAQKVVKMDVRTQKFVADASSASKDLQIVSTQVAVNYHLLPGSVPKLYKEIGKSYEDRVIQPAVQEGIKAITARYTAEELITKRQEVKDEIKLFLDERLAIRDIIIQEISITNFDFSESFNSAIEAKVTAEQQKLKAERDLERIRVEAEQKIAQAQAEAESIKIQSQALLESQNVLELRWIEKWDGIMPTTYVSGDQDLLIGLSETSSQS